METSTLLALCGVIVTLSGWLYERHKDERFKRIDARRKYFERQIEEFYGPLFTLVHSVFTHYQVLHKLTKEKKASEALTPQQREQIESYYEDTYFLPLHLQIKEILHTKLYLIEGDDVPASFLDYLEHSLQARAQREIYTKLSISTIHVRGKDWPEEFYNDIKQGFDSIMRKYEDSTAQIKMG
jgi:hypothetical protein